ncbi:peptidoglycan -binding protein [Rhodobacter capsulatus]|uniref:peptidoglycan -binding protein n=1 Tax=Rhodobacter capsulatus TaxID=1061 RepID=UPI0006DD3564|nr:peptidoglycan -binding protein [Rhodobacter capsulatus]KQB12926.1 flagellar motor protein MotB [Rhodobacter capsulatus]KQB13026.1 flagellar motor protein MotB [Rhodobacter capsulatus]PZX28468.1 chemotaxis protein MotB [Rhodobacter capsulatus]QNR62745.1 peptidoglycan -binding protein [Rhodobacter capsulatus]
MALSGRRGQRFTTNVWPGFVDAMGALLMVLIFVLSIFMMVQSMLRDTITTKDHELDALSAQVAGLAQALSLEQAQTEALTGRLEAAGARITAFEAQVAGLLADKTAQEAVIAGLQGDLKSSDTALTAARLQLEDARKKAEETLTLLAAAEAAQKDLQGRLEVQLSAAEKQAALQALAEKTLTETRAEGDRKAEQVALLNQQVAALRGQLSDLQAVLDAAEARDADAKVQVEALGSQLNSALAQVAAEQKRRAALEEEARKKAEAEAKELARYRSEFFGRMSQLLDGRAGVRVVGDRFVFSSEVLFQPGSADLSPEGQAQISRVAETFRELASEIPPEIDWLLEVDGFTDDTPLSGQGAFKDNWQLSQARALSVVKYLIEAQGFAPKRLAAAGFGEFRPVAAGKSPEARAQNRRIELKLTER